MHAQPEPMAPPRYVRTAARSFLGSLNVDRSLVRYDLAGSIAHAKMLHSVGLLSAEESAALTAGLRTIAREVEAGRFPWREELEDVHTNVEVRLTELIGPVAGKLHTGRSRNDQIALDERLDLRAHVAGLVARLLRVQRALMALAEREQQVPMPGYTHLQRAQPVTLGHHLLAHYWRFDRDIERLFATLERADVSPLGAGALAGSTLPIDPEATARRLGFSRTFRNSLDAVSDRDPSVELLFDLALLHVHASGLGEELVLFATSEFGFLERTEALGAGSSQMPQKRNPDVAELVRGKTGRAVGNLVGLLTVLKGLPLAYNRDLQEDKAAVLDSVAGATAVLDALAALVPELKFDRERLLSASSDPELYATDRAESMVARGATFRAAHETVGSADPARFRSPGVEPRHSPAEAVALRATPGGPAPAAVERQLAQAGARLDAHAASLSSLDRKVALVEELLKEDGT